VPPANNILLEACFTSGRHLFVSLHHRQPMTQASSELSYSGYARVRADQWLVRGNAATNINAISFPMCHGGSELVTHFAIGSDASGAGTLFWRGALTDWFHVSNGITMHFKAGSICVTVEDIGPFALPLRQSQINALNALPPAWGEQPVPPAPPVKPTAKPKHYHPPLYYRKLRLP
jgi:hypothetical protein